MDKLTDLKWKLAGECSPHAASMGFANGFDAAMELQLPVKFAEWWWEMDVLKIDKWEEIMDMDWTGRFNYFLKNIYQP